MMISFSALLNRNLRNIPPMRVLLVTLSAMVATTTACVSDSDKCGDLLLWKDPTGKTYDLCTPGQDTDTQDTTPAETDSPIADAGADASAPDEGATCTGSEDCAADEYCDLTLSPPECLPPPSGQGNTCATHDDCAGFDADYCESFVSFTCLVDQCSPDANNCTNDYICCDFSTYGLPSLCVARALNGDVCP